MHLIRLPNTVALALAMLLCAVATADTTTQRDAAGFGPDDTLGAANHLSNAGVVAASRLVTTGKRYALGLVSSRDTPVWGEREYAIEVVGLPIPGTELILGHDDRVHTHLGIGTQIDGLGHVGLGGKFYNGLSPADFAAPDGLRKLGTEHIPPIVTRGVLLDVTRTLGVDRLGPSEPISAALLQKTAKAQGIGIGRGDVVLVHTGWMDIMDSDPATYIGRQPGLDASAAEFLARAGVVAIGSDTGALEVQPSADPDHIVPVHGLLLANHGVYILENIVTRELAADSAWEFMFVLGQPRLAGSVQAIINPVAIR
jgi:kynurenine formamidase